MLIKLISAHYLELLLILKFFDITVRNKAILTLINLKIKIYKGGEKMGKTKIIYLYIFLYMYFFLNMYIFLTQTIETLNKISGFFLATSIAMLIFYPIFNKYKKSKKEINISTMIVIVIVLLFIVNPIIYKIFHLN